MNNPTDNQDDTCRWSVRYHRGIYSPDTATAYIPCEIDTLTFENMTKYDFDLKLCPYCGKKIEVEG